MNHIIATMRPTRSSTRIIAKTNESVPESPKSDHEDENMPKNTKTTAKAVKKTTTTRKTNRQSKKHVVASPSLGTPSSPKKKKNTRSKPATPKESPKKATKTTKAKGKKKTTKKLLDVEIEAEQKKREKLDRIKALRMKTQQRQEKMAQEKADKMEQEEEETEVVSKKKTGKAKSSSSTTRSSARGKKTTTVAKPSPQKASPKSKAKGKGKPKTTTAKGKAKVEKNPLVTTGRRISELAKYDPKKKMSAAQRRKFCKTVLPQDQINAMDVDAFIGLKCIRQEFLIEKHVGKGAFGHVFLATDRKKRTLALKIEPGDSVAPQLLQETGTLKNLKNAARENKTEVCFPQYWMHSSHETFEGIAGVFKVMAMDLLGDNLESLFKHNRVDENSGFDDLSASLVGARLVEALQSMHEMGYVHRDLKPGNIMTGHGNKQNKLFLVDFGLTENWNHLTRNPNAKVVFQPMVGTPAFVSLGVHEGLYSSRVDDLESAGWVMLYLHLGYLPWMEAVRGRNDLIVEEKYEIMEAGKRKVLEDMACDDTSKFIIEYIAACHEMDRDEVPDYDSLIKIWGKMAKKAGGKLSQAFPWVSGTKRKLVEDEDDEEEDEEQEEVRPKRQAKKAKVVKKKTPVKRSSRRTRK